MHEIKGGRHVAEIYGCDVSFLEDEARVKFALEHVLLTLGANKENLQIVAHKFDPQGLSASAVSSIGLIAIHTWPEDAAATLDLYFHINVDPKEVLEQLAKDLGAKETDSFELHRGHTKEG